MAQESCVNLGLVADAQYAPVDPDAERDRYFDTAPRKLNAVFDEFEARGINTVVSLGDIIDHDVRNLPTILGTFAARDSIQVLHVLGNHDLINRHGPEDNPSRMQSVLDQLGLSGGSYYARDLSDAVRMIFLDGNVVSVRSPDLDQRAHAHTLLQYMKAEDAINAHPSNGALGAVQHAWLRDELDQSLERSQRAMIFCHFPVHEVGVGRLWDGPEVLRTIANYPHVAAVFSGHEHAGGYALQQGNWYGMPNWTHHLTLKGLVQTRDQTSGAVLHIDPQLCTLGIAGIGRQPSFSWDLPKLGICRAVC